MKIKLNQASVVKAKLNEIITDTDINRRQYVVNPDKDFIRNRKLPFKRVISFLIEKGASSVQNELLDFFEYKSDTPTVAALVKQRSKIKLDCFHSIFHNFASSFNKLNLKTFKGYRLIAVDGTDILFPTNPKDKNTYVKMKDKKGFNYMHATALYDVLNGFYLDASIDGSTKCSERKEFIKLINRCELPQNSLFLADRGFEAYNSFANLIEKKVKFVFRVKDIHSNQTLSFMNLPDKELDIISKKMLTRFRRKGTYPAVPDDVTISCLDRGNLDFFTPEKPYYYLELRIVRFKLNNGDYEALITNVLDDEMSVEELKELYHMRWGIETSFRQLKFTIGMRTFHSANPEFVKQEIMASFILYNFCAIIATLVDMKKNDHKRKKYEYKTNWATAARICKAYFRQNSNPIDVEELIQRFLIPIRPGRSSARKVQHQKAPNFQNRIA